MAVDSRKIKTFSRPFELDLHEFEPEDMEPIGDRYIVEELGVNEQVEFGSLTLLVQGEPGPNDDPRNPMSNPNVEKRGVMPAVVISKGNGHLLGFPDPRFVVKRAGGEYITRESADVPMWLERGDVVLIDINMKGRALRIAGRTLRTVNQMDVLVKLTKVRLVRKDGKWEREE